MEHPETPERSPLTLSPRLIAGLLALVSLTFLCLAGGVCLSYLYIRQAAQATSWNIPFMGEPAALNQIAFIGNDGNLGIISPDGTGLRYLTSGNQTYRFPTWSPDSRQLAFIGPGEGATSLYVSPAGRNEPKEVYSQPGSPPFYLYWSPDSRLLSFLTQEKAGLSLRLVDTQTPGSQRVMSEGSPFYWAWSPSGDRMVVHVGGSRDLSPEAHVSVLENRPVVVKSTDLKIAPGRFQAPAWSSDGQYLFYIAGNEAGTDAIYRTRADTLEEDLILNLVGFTHLVLSPDNRYLAYLQFEQGTRPPFGRAYLLDIETREDKLLTKDLVASIYWSPDGSKLALLSLNLGPDGPTAKAAGLAAPLPQQAVLRWWVYNLKEETLEPLFSFNPTTQFLQTVPFFDQYHLSLTFWSPDSRYLVVTRREDEQGNGSIWVVDTSGQEENRKVGEGTLAVWSWQ